MPTILALDSSTDACSVALSVEGRVTHQFELAIKSHTQRLLPMVDELLRAAGCQLKDLDAIAYGRGPGSFTGLRICMGIVQGLAFGADLPVIPVSTLHALAQGFAEDNPQNLLPLMVALDARMEEIYWGLFNAEPLVQESAPEYVMKPEDVCVRPELMQLQKQFVAVGPGWHYAGLQTILPAQVTLERHPHAKDILAIAVQEFDRGRSISVLDAQPVYLRDSVSWKKRQRIRTAPSLEI